MLQDNGRAAYKPLLQQLIVFLPGFWEDLADIAALGAMAQGLVHQHQRQHRLRRWRGTDADAGVVAAGDGD